MPYRYLHTSSTADHGPRVAVYVRHSGPTVLPEARPALGPGVPLVFVHGVAGNQGVFDGVFDALAGRHGSIALDLPAHGRSGALDALASVAEMSDFARAVASQLGVERPVVVGHGLGAAIALEWAQREPGTLRGVVACACGSRNPDRSETIAQVQRVTEGKERRAFVREIYAPDTKPDVMQRGFMQSLKTDPRAELGDWRALAAWPGLADEAGFATPTLLVHGVHDDAALCAEIERLAAGLPHARRVALGDAAYQVPFEQPQALAEAVVDFAGGLA